MAKRSRFRSRRPSATARQDRRTPWTVRLRSALAATPDLLLHPSPPDEPPWKLLLPVLALAFAARAAVALSCDFVLHPDEIMPLLALAVRRAPDRPWVVFTTPALVVLAAAIRLQYAPLALLVLGLVFLRTRMKIQLALTHRRLARGPRLLRTSRLLPSAPRHPLLRREYGTSQHSRTADGPSWRRLRPRSVTSCRRIRRRPYPATRWRGRSARSGFCAVTRGRPPFAHGRSTLRQSLAVSSPI